MVAKQQQQQRSNSNSDRAVYAADEPVQPLKCLEFFAGIGGFHYALQEAGVKVVIRALDINTVTNSIYKYNFPDTEIQQCNIQKLTSDYYDDYNADLWTLSPPCQPFTKKGSRKDMEDHRCDALKSICVALGLMKHPPRYIILENVCGFETSKAHSLLKETLLRAGYYIEEYNVSPTKIGIPNSRPRYYLLAKLTYSFDGQSASKTINTWPVDDNFIFCQRVIGDYLCSEANEDSKLSISHSTVKRFGNAIHFVTSQSTQSNCFTKSYYRYTTGTGPILLQLSDMEDKVHMTVKELRNIAIQNTDLAKYRVRYFSWREVANLLGFPSSFAKPLHITTKQMYHALGNSITVPGVSLLIQHLLRV